MHTGIIKAERGVAHTDGDTDRKYGPGSPKLLGLHHSLKNLKNKQTGKQTKGRERRATRGWGCGEDRYDSEGRNKLGWGELINGRNQVGGRQWGCANLMDRVFLCILSS